MSIATAMLSPKQRWTEMQEVPSFEELEEIDPSTAEFIDELFIAEEGKEIIDDLLNISKRANSKFRDELVHHREYWGRKRELFRAEKIEAFAADGKIAWGE